jgi:HEAT repeat protein
MAVDDDARTTQELFETSLRGTYNDEDAWDAIRVLRIRGTDEVFRSAIRYCGSTVPLERARGLDVLAQLGAGRPDSDRPHVVESVALAISCLRDPDPRVVSSAAWALAHLGGDVAVSALIPLRHSPDAYVRWAVANGLNGTERADGIEVLIGLMDDTDDNVRDWATFALGSQCSVNSAQILDALRRRLGDGYEDARREAIWGLALRKDTQGLKILTECLDEEPWSGDLSTAAEVLGLPYDTAAEQLRIALGELLRSHLPL